jgi:sec-independent protein translocase protein TatC
MVTEVSTDHDINDPPKPLGEHLEELRWRILRALILFVALMVLLFFFERGLKELLIWPFRQAKVMVGEEVVRKLGLKPGPLAADFVTLSMQESVMASLRVTFLAALAISIPYLLFQVWAFVRPALRRQERRLAFLFLPLAVILFYIGCFVGYRWGVPLFYVFLMQWTAHDPTATLMPRLDDYIGFFTMLTVSFGLVMEIPWLIMVLTRVGLVTPRWLARQRRYVCLIAIILAAVLTPPDPISQIALFIPILCLFEMGLLASRFLLPAPAGGEGRARDPSVVAGTDGTPSPLPTPVPVAPPEERPPCIAEPSSSSSDPIP